MFGKAKAKEVARWANRAWLVGISLSLMASAYKLNGLMEKRSHGLLIRSAEGKVEVRRIGREVKETRIQVLQDACDWIIPAYALGIVGQGGKVGRVGYVVDEGLVGLAGIVSSLVGLRAQWKKTAQ